MSNNNNDCDLQSRYEFNSSWAERIAFLIIVGLAVEIAAVFIFRKPFWEGVSTIVANVLIVAGVWGELIFERRAKAAGDGIVAKANARAAEANAQAAVANERASEANQRALELEAQLKPRWDVSRATFKVLVDLFKEHKDRIGAITVWSFTSGDDPEASGFAGMLFTAMREAEIDCDSKVLSVDSIKAGSIEVDGVVLDVHSGIQTIVTQTIEAQRITAGALNGCLLKSGLMTGIGGVGLYEREIPRTYLVILLKPIPFSGTTPDWIKEQWERQREQRERQMRK
jgi:hypothetical protein